MRLLLHNLHSLSDTQNLIKSDKKKRYNEYFELTQKKTKSELEILKYKIQMCLGIQIFKALLHYFTVNTRPQSNAAYVHLNYKCKLRQVKIKVTGQ